MANRDTSTTTTSPPSSKTSSCSCSSNSSSGTLSSPVSLLLRPLSDAWALAHAAYQFVYDTIDRPQCRWWPIKQPLFRCPSDDGVWLRDVDKAQINAWFKGDIDRDGFVPCSELHWGLCNVRHVQVFGIAFWRAMKMYIPVHFIPVLLYKRGKLFKSVPVFARWVANSFVSACRSSAFLGVYCMLFAFVLCTCRNITKRDSVVYANIGGFVCGWSLLLEEHVRRREIATYCIPQVLEIWGKYLVSRGWISPVAHWEVLVFCVALGVLMFYYKRHPRHLKSATETVLTLVFE